MGGGMEKAGLVSCLPPGECRRQIKLETPTFAAESLSILHRSKVLKLHCASASASHRIVSHHVHVHADLIMLIDLLYRTSYY